MMKRNNRTVTDEAVISALMQFGTVESAADAAGCEPSVIYDRLNRPEPEFVRLYTERLKAAVTTFCRITADPAVDIRTRAEIANVIRSASDSIEINSAISESTCEEIDRVLASMTVGEMYA